MFGDLEWLFWFLIVGGVIILVWFGTMHCLCKDEKKDRPTFKIGLLEENYLTVDTVQV